MPPGTDNPDPSLTGMPPELVQLIAESLAGDSVVEYHEADIYRPNDSIGPLPNGASLDEWRDLLDEGYIASVDSSYRCLFSEARKTIHALVKALQDIRPVAARRCLVALYQYSAKICDNRHDVYVHHACDKHIGSCCVFLDHHPWFHLTALESAITTGKNSRVKVLLKYTTQACGLQHLCYAIQAAHRKTVELLMALDSVQEELVGVNAEIRQKFKRSPNEMIVATPSHPVFQAVLAGDVQLAAWVLQKDPKAYVEGAELIPAYFHPCWRLDGGNVNRELPIEMACRLGNSKMLRLLLSAGGVQDQTLDGWQQSLGDTYMEHTIQNVRPSDSSGHVNCAQELIAWSPDLGRSIRHINFAVSSGIWQLYGVFRDVDVTQHPLFDALQGYHRYPLFRAMCSGNLLIVRDLLNRGAPTELEHQPWSTFSPRQVLTIVGAWPTIGVKYARAVMDRMVQDGSPPSEQTLVWAMFTAATHRQTAPQAARYHWHAWGGEEKKEPNFEVIKYLQGYGATLKYHPKLYLICLCAEPALAEILLSFDANVTSRSGKHTTAIRRANMASEDFLEEFNKVVTQYCGAGAPSEKAYATAVAACIKHSSDEFHWSSQRLEILLAAFPRRAAILKHINPLCIAAEECSLRDIDVLLRHGFVPLGGAQYYHHRYRGSELRYCLLAKAPSEDWNQEKIGILERLLYAGANPNQEPDRAPLLILALRIRGLGSYLARAVELLMRHGARPQSLFEIERITWGWELVNEGGAGDAAAAEANIENTATAPEADT